MANAMFWLRAGLMLGMLGGTAVAAAAQQEPTGKLARAGDSISGVHPKRSLKAAAPATGFIDNAVELKELLTAWGYKDVNWTTDFQENIVLVGTADGPNRVRLAGRMKEGNLDVMAMATRMAGPGFGWAMLVYPREGVETVEGHRLPEPGSGSDQDAEPDPAERDAEPIVLTEADKGKTVEAAVGQEIVIRLKGNPTTGFRWDLTRVEGESLEQKGELSYEGPARPLAGAGGTFVARFQAVREGEATVAMHYARPWEKDRDPAETFDVTVKVAEAAETPAVRIVSQWRGSQGGRAPGQRIITDQRTFDAAWKARGRGEPPEIDFSRHTVLLVDMGRRNTGGYSVRIESVERKDGKVVATVRYRAPGPGDMVTQALTSPWCMAEIDVAAKDVEFREVDSPRDGRGRGKRPPAGFPRPLPRRLPGPAKE